MWDRDLHAPTHTGVGISWGQTPKAQVEVGRSPKDCCACSCGVGYGQAPDHALLGWPRCTGLRADHTWGHIPALPLLAVQGGASEMT